MALRSQIEQADRTPKAPVGQQIWDETVLGAGHYTSEQAAAMVEDASRQTAKLAVGMEDEGFLLDVLGLTDDEEPPEPPRPVKPQRNKARPSRSEFTRPEWGWQDNAACRGEPLVTFFGVDGERQPEREIRERKAQQICAGCPVRRQCLDYAVSRPEKHGYWGAMGEEDRATERRRRQRRANAA